jgi:Protein of unknown function (DUF2892)
MERKVPMLTLNEGLLDRTIRIVIGAILVLAAITIRDSAWGYAGLIPLVTGTVGYSPFYALFDLSTYGKRSGLQLGLV